MDVSATMVLTVLACAIVIILSIAVGGIIRAMNPKRMIQEYRFVKLHGENHLPMVSQRSTDGVTYKVAVGTEDQFDAWMSMGVFDDEFPYFDFDFLLDHRGWTMSDGSVYMVNRSSKDNYHEYQSIMHDLIKEHQKLYGDEIGLESTGMYIPSYLQAAMEYEYADRFPGEWEKFKGEKEAKNYVEPIDHFVKQLA
jgi:hypothetical protein